MADLSDVETALVRAIVAAVYPTGTSQPSRTGVPTKVYRGWPNAAKLDEDIEAGRLNVSVFPRSGMSRNTTRYQQEWRGCLPPPPTVTATPSGNTVIIGGTTGTAQTAGIMLFGTAYIHPVSPTDTPATIASALAALIPGASASGSTVTVPASPDLRARCGGFGTATLETRRQEQGFQVTVWCPTQALRDSASSLVDTALSRIRFLTFPDGTHGRLQYETTVVSDEATKGAIWRRDLMYSVEYGTTIQELAAAMLFGGIDTTNGSARTRVTV